MAEWRVESVAVMDINAVTKQYRIAVCFNRERPSGAPDTINVGCSIELTGLERLEVALDRAVALARSMLA